MGDRAGVDVPSLVFASFRSGQVKDRGKTSSVLDILVDHRSLKQPLEGIDCYLRFMHRAIPVAGESYQRFPQSPAAIVLIRCSDKPSFRVNIKDALGNTHPCVAKTFVPRARLGGCLDDVQGPDLPVLRARMLAIVELTSFGRRVLGVY